VISFTLRSFYPRRIYPSGTRWMGPRAGSEPVEYKRSFIPARESNPGRPAHLLNYPAKCRVTNGELERVLKEVVVA
jgi:hypothetical protein